MARDSISLLLAGASAEGVRTARKIRDRLIAEAHQAGWSYRRISAATGVSYRTVQRIVQRAGRGR